MLPQSPLSTEEIDRLGPEAFDRHVWPRLVAEDEGKFVAVDALTGDYEIDADS